MIILLGKWGEHEVQKLFCVLAKEIADLAGLQEDFEHMSIPEIYEKCLILYWAFSREVRMIFPEKAYYAWNISLYH